jgi:hypothetical protein
MKKIFLTFLILFFCLIKLLAQDTLTPKMVLSGNVSRMKYYDVYANDVIVVKVGDTLKLGSAVGGKYFSYISEIDLIGSSGDSKLDAQYAGNNCIIKKIYVIGSNRAGYSAYMQFKGPFAWCFYVFPFEPAIGSGEIILHNYYTSDVALSELKKAKEKLDLGLISNDEYDKIKKEMSKFIK